MDAWVNIVRQLVRPVVTLGFAGCFVYLSIVGLVPIEAFISLASMTILYFFKTRDEEKQSERQPHP